MNTGSAQPGYDEVRRRLRERGYLEGRLQRFVLRSALAAGSRLGRLVGVATRGAVLGGPLLGVLLAVTTALTQRPRLTATDTFVLALYASALGAALIFVLLLAVAIFVGALARWRGARPSDTSVAALLAGVPLLGYLALLLAQRPAPGGWPADVAIMAAALGVTLFVGWLAGLVSLAGILGRTGEIPDRRRPLLWAGSLALIAAGVAAWEVLPTPSRDARDETAPAFEIVPREGRTVILGIDGLDGSLIEAFEPGGSFGSVLDLLERGVTFPLGRRWGAEPPEVWTTLLTGRAVDAHEVRDVAVAQIRGIGQPIQERRSPLAFAAAVKFLLPARTVPLTGTTRRVRTLAEIAALRHPTIAVGWWASWPAVEGESPGSYLVTDRVLAKLLADRPGDRDTAPASLYGRLAAEFPQDRAAIREQFDAIFAGSGDGVLASWAWESYLIDGYAWAVTRRLLGDPQVRAAFIYLPGLDILRWRVALDRRSAHPTRLLQTHEALEGYARLIDRLVASVQREVPEAAIVLIADPGRQAERGDDGFVAAAGPGIPPACVGPRLNEEQVAPLVLRILGFPASMEMAGEPPATCLEGLGPVPAPIATYGARSLRAIYPAVQDDEAEIVERLKSLGYLK